MKPQLLMLDEPTNHIDLAGAVWLSEFCKEWPTTLAVITHNAHFVNNVCTGIWDLKQKGVRSYKCSYNMYLKQLVSDSLASAAAWEKVEKQVATWRSKGTPAASKLADDFLAKKAAEGIRRPDRGYAPRFLLAEHATTDNREKTSIISLTDAVAKYSSDGPAILRGVEFALYNGSRVSLVGANGAGKSTFLKMLTGELDPVEGTIMRKNGLRVAFFHQHFFHDLPQEMSAAEYIRSEFEKARKGTGITTTEEEVRKLLGTTGMESTTHTIEIRFLSGGQKARVYFAGIAASAPELLVLDEPSNHLDMETAKALLDALKVFPGAVVIVSHDLSFLEELDPDVWLCQNGRVEHLGHGDAALNKYIEDTLKEPETVEPPPRTAAAPVVAVDLSAEEAAAKDAKRRAMLNKFFDSEKRRLKKMRAEKRRLEEEEAAAELAY
jgi:ATP-binding cassette subfamily F protein 1